MNLSSGFLRLRRSARAFARSPRLSIALTLTIALGVGSNVSIYGFLQGLIHPVTPIRSEDGLVSVFGQDRSRDAAQISIDTYQGIRKRRDVFAWVGALHTEPRTAVVGGYSEIVTIGSMTPEVARLLQLSPGNGAVISHSIWQNEFSGREQAVGSLIKVGGTELKVDGVAPQRLDGLYSDQNIGIWINAERENFEGGRDQQRLWVVAKLRDGVSLRRAQQIISSGSAKSSGLSVVPYTGLAPKMAQGLSRIGIFLLFSAGAVFFIACINVASFLLGRALRRSHETSLRIALGATRAELLWDLLADSIVIAMAGGTVGLLLGLLTARTLPAFLFEEDAERLSFALHLLPIFTAAAFCVLVTAICGMMPVAGTVTDRPWMVLQRETGSPSRALLRMRSSLVVGQIAVCCMLVICTGILRVGLRSALQTSAGYRLGNPVLLTAQAQVSRNGPEIDTSYFSEVETKTASVGGLLPLAWTASLPGNQPTWRSFRLQQSSSQYREVLMDISWLTPESMQSLGAQPVAGRMFGPDDAQQKVAVLNEEAAAEIFGTHTAGMVIRDAANLPIQIIGVVRQTPTQAFGGRKNSMRAQQKVRPTIYYGYLNQAEPPSVTKNAAFRVPVAEPAANIELSTNIVSAGYFRAIGMPLISGHDFSGSRGFGAGRVAVINQEAADLDFNGKPLGSGVIDDNGERTEIIGVARSQVFGAFEQHAEPAIYFPMDQDCPARMTLMLKAAKWNRGIEVALRDKIEHVPGGSQGSMMIKSLNEQLEQSGLAPLRIAMLIGGVSSVIALLLGILGLLNAQNDAERQRQRDRAVRIALGAQRWRIVLLVMKTAGRLALAGTVIGVALSFALMRLLIADFAGLASPPFEVWAIAPMLPAAAVVIASMIPARRASAIAPSVIMREN